MKCTIKFLHSFLVLYTLEISENCCVPEAFGGVEMEHWFEMA